MVEEIAPTVLAYVVDGDKYGVLTALGALVVFRNPDEARKFQECEDKWGLSDPGSEGMAAWMSSRRAIFLPC